MVDEAGDATLLGRVDDRVLVDTEQVTAAHALLEVSHLANLRNLLADLLANVLDDHVVFVDILLCIETPVVDRRTSKLDRLLSLLELVELEHVGIARRLHFVLQRRDVPAVVGTVGSRIALCRGRGRGRRGCSLAVLLHSGLSRLSGLLDLDVVRKILGLFRVENLLDRLRPGATSRIGNVVTFDSDRLFRRPIAPSSFITHPS